MALPGCFAELLANFLADFAADILKIPSPSKKSALKSVHNFACTAGQEIRVPKQKNLAQRRSTNFWSSKHEASTVYP